MALNTRPPTCLVPWPLILVEGGEKSGKSWLFAELSASDKVGRCVWIDLGEGSADEYGDAITGEITYEVVIHDGSWASIFGQIADAHAAAAKARDAGEKPFCLGIDSATLLWEMLKDWAAARAAGSDSNKARLAKDPNAEIKVPNLVWNDVAARWQRMMRLLMTFPGICVITARGKETVKIENGRPVEGETVYKVETQKNLQYDASVWLRVSRDAPPMIVGARSKHLRIRHGRDEGRVLSPDATLEQLIFEGLRCGQDSQPRDLVRLGRERLPETIRDEALATRDRDELLALLAETAHPTFAGVTVENENGNEELLHELVLRHGREATGKADSPAKPEAKPNRFAKVRDDRAAQDIPAAPASAGMSPDEPADEKLLGRVKAVLAACQATSGPAQAAVCAALLGRSMKTLDNLTRAEAVKVGNAVLVAAQQKDPRQALAAIVGQAINNRKAA